MVPPSKSFRSSGAPAEPVDPVNRPDRVDEVVFIPLRMHSSKETISSSANGLMYRFLHIVPEALSFIVVVFGWLHY